MTRELATLFNLWMKFRKVPTFQCEHRTVSIQKSGASPQNMGTWRSITISNLLRILECDSQETHKSMPIHEIQRGFVSCDGIADNNFLFVRILKDGNTTTRETAIVLLDFARFPTSKTYTTSCQSTLPSNISTFGDMIVLWTFWLNNAEDMTGVSAKNTDVGWLVGF
ncbi:hypothetical protein AVEN_229073-1 [Araneus ventricosus]|uniref:Reverse transcriptase domain-containing protein n=1 Tax=Araneus ventricosus TaxID=182803 RepID=A0A4Y2GU01_ARAVE|nr:hypothetical protein AVEN_229073-1 [Araneus ventricosus]